MDLLWENCHLCYGRTAISGFFYRFSILCGSRQDSQLLIAFLKLGGSFFLLRLRLVGPCYMFAKNTGWLKKYKTSCFSVETVQLHTERLETVHVMRIRLQRHGGSKNVPKFGRVYLGSVMRYPGRSFSVYTLCRGPASW
jgi:hypothetical protein